MDKCFVIQPFDNAKFDQRYADTFRPAIINAGLEPYRIDHDLSVRVPIDEIEKGISECAICFAEISTDNPNVWYELGFSFARNKDVVMVCSDERQGKFPFDIQHRQILNYKTSSKSDFVNLEELITKKINALQSNIKTVKVLNETPVVDTEGLKSHELAILILITENSLTRDDSMPVYLLNNSMDEAGYTNIATSVGIRTLLTKELIETTQDSDWNGNVTTNCRLTEKGENWILQNQHLLVYRKEKSQPSKKSSTVNDDDDDLPF